MTATFVNFEGSADFAYPMCMKVAFGSTQFPMLEEDSVMFGMDAEQAEKAYNDDCDDEVAHPVIALLKAGEEIESVEVGDSWRDDRCDCYNVIVAVGGKKYGFSMWWLSSEGTRMLYRAEGGNKKAIAQLKSDITTYG